MGYVIIDLEFNNLQNMDRYFNSFKSKHPELYNIDIQNEIIEIGAIKIDEHMKFIDSVREYIKPKIFPILNPAITEITKITSATLENQGTSFLEAISSLRELFDDGDILCSWAKDDVVELVLNAQYYGYKDLDWIKNYIDIQEYATNVLGHKKCLGLKNALNQLRIKVDNNKLHDALNDAYYTVEVMKRIYNPRIMKKYIVENIYTMPSIFIKDLKNIDIMHRDLKLHCPKCNGKINLTTDILPINWRFVGVGKCDKCSHNILCEIIVKKTLQGEVLYDEIHSVVSNEVYLDYIYKIKNIIDTANI